MIRSGPIVALCAFALVMPAALAATTDDAAALRAELDALKADYAGRIGALEARIAQLEAAAQAAPEPPATPPSPPLPSPADPGSSATAFNRQPVAMRAIWRAALLPSPSEARGRPAVSLVPHSAQNLCPTCTSAPHVGHVAISTSWSWSASAFKALAELYRASPFQ